VDFKCCIFAIFAILQQLEVLEIKKPRDLLPGRRGGCVGDGERVEEGANTPIIVKVLLFL
jgi:hypothetical protein